jgi:chromosomal replication initiator protein
MNPRPWTLARFVILPENRAAAHAVEGVVSAVLEASAAPGLFLHGPPGTGKSHLATAGAETFARRRADARVAIVSARDWGPEEPAECADLDLLIVEDLQFLANRSADSLAHTWDERQAHGLATIGTATQAPRQLDTPARLVNRLVGGLVVGLEALAAPSRRLLLTELAARADLTLDSTVLDWLGERLTGNARVLEGAVQQLRHLARQHRHLDVATVAAHWSDGTGTGQPTLERIVQRVCSHFGVSGRLVLSPGRQRAALLPRQLGMYLARRLTGLSLGEIGRGFGRDHTTVLHSCRKIEQALASDAALAGTVRQLSADLV